MSRGVAVFQDLGGVSEMPDACRTCGQPWHAVECVHTGDSAAVGGWEDWCYCATCKEDWFYPLKPNLPTQPGEQA